MPNYSGIWTEQAVMQANGAGNWPNAPGAPTIGTATNTGDGGTVSVAFTAPTFAGLPAVITSYTVTSSPGGFTGTGASSPITVSGLTNGTAYTFTVTATNASGTGPASAASNSVTPSLIVYVEDVFSAYLYAGSNSATTITNGIDLSTKGGLVWSKGRTGTADNNLLIDTVRGVNKPLRSNETAAQYTETTLTAFNTTGYNITGANGDINLSGRNYVGWTFREQPKFFDVVTLNSSTTTYNHNLGSTPGCIIVKCTDASGAYWVVWHRSFANTTNNYLSLNTTDAVDNFTNAWPSAPTSTQFSVNPSLWANGTTGIAYLFAHNAGGFGANGTDNVISCGSFTTDGSGNATVTLGYEPQWVLMKASSGTGSWFLTDNMRGMSYTGGNYLLANTSAAEVAGNAYLRPTATGFGTFAFGPGSLDYIYIAIRRGPMKVPTTGTSVFAPIARTGTSSSNTAVTAGFPVDAAFIKASSTVKPWDVEDRLRGGGKYLEFQSTAAEVAGSPAATINFTASNTGVLLGTDSYVNSSANSYANYFLQRAPSFFDEVCYTGTGAAQTLTHNLAAVPELMISRRRDAVAGWAVYSATLGATKYMRLQTDDAPSTGTTLWNDTAPTSTQFTLGSTQSASSGTYVQYLFATCAGVSKVGSYTGTGTTQTINCGFAAGSRFVMIKRTDSTGDWYVWDSARGIIAGNDPYLLLNSTAAQVTNTDYVDTAATGFEISSTAPAAINANGGTFIFLAIA